MILAAPGKVCFRKVADRIICSPHSKKRWLDELTKQNRPGGHESAFAVDCQTVTSAEQQTANRFGRKKEKTSVGTTSIVKGNSFVRKEMESVVDVKFPVTSLVPKNETGALSFIRMYPEYDGRDVTIAILDSGVDPRAKGLEQIPGGDVKVIERYDCSGCGDVDTSKTVTASQDGTITGLSGRKLQLSATMKSKNIAGSEYRVGLKSVHDLSPSRIRERILNDLKVKTWDDRHKQAVSEAARELSDFEAKNPPTGLSGKEKLVKENLESQLEFLNTCDKKFADLKTSYDCVLFPTKEGWMAVIDTTEKGDLENAVHVVEYTRSHQLVNLDDFLSVSINVHDEGNVLEVVGVCSSHGTHVASIASGYHPDDPELNGVAPAAKIVSLTIGDGRLESMETGTALVRAIIKVMELCEAGRKIDVINMSYGEHGHWSNSGRVGELMSELVNRYGVVWVASAGNHGPALCTIGTPPDISQPSCVGVGAYVSPEMMEAEYALHQKLPGNCYTWSSRDPCIDGGFGVTVCAPGAAIASVPQFTMSKAQLMNGTSMSAPHVAGSVGLLISGLKQKAVPYTAFSIKRALWNTATKIDYVDKFAQGNGLLNVGKAFDHLTTYCGLLENKLRFSVTVGNNNAKGIHMRHGVLTKVEDFSVNIEPVIFNEKYADAADKINFNVRLTLIPTESWINCGSYLDLCYSARKISVKVDPSGLAPGVYRASVKAYDSACPAKGVLFEIPVTVVQPHVVDAKSNEFVRGDLPVDCKPHTLIRDFILVPKYATWAVIEMRSADTNDAVGGKFFLHTLQILPMKFCKAMEMQKILPVNGTTPTVQPVRVEGDHIIEICIAKFWSNFGTLPLRYSVKFHGISPLNGSVMHSASGIHRIDLTALTSEEVHPVVSLKTAAMVLKPSETKVTPLTARDVIHPARQIYQTLITYQLHLAKGYEVAFYTPLFSNILYESEFESQFWMVFDANKLMVRCGDAYSYDKYEKLEKGDYTIRLQVRHEKKELLEKLTEANMIVNFKLASNSLSVDVYKSYNQVLSGAKKMTSCFLAAGVCRPIYLAPVPSEKLQKASIPPQCSWLEGSITYAKEDIIKKCVTHSFQYILTEGPPAKKSSTAAASVATTATNNASNGSHLASGGSNGSGTVITASNGATANSGPPNGTTGKETRSKWDEYCEGLRDYQTAQIAKLDSENADNLYHALLKENPNHLAAHLAMADHYDSSELKQNLPYAFTKSFDPSDPAPATLLKVKLLRIIELTSLVVKDIDQNALLAYYGMKVDNRPNAAKIKIQMDKQKQLLLDACQRKFVALCKLRVLQNLFDAQDVSQPDYAEELDQLYGEVGKFIEYTDSKVLLLTIWHAFSLKQYGRMVKYLNKLYEEKLSRDILEEILAIVDEKKWAHVHQQLSKIIVSSNPQGYRLF
ncbi:tripeptidyl-peptidase 2 [Anopheles moucheti]|uniref:tripeptidyl-peptidase 2 n=1 Tax=Anopheles moucheti TaxID=186751 RepID=UPI0022F0BC23|nr:tripeptidyl-peptidase 2 [Anopheles moucheti]